MKNSSIKSRRRFLARLFAILGSSTLFPVHARNREDELRIRVLAILHNTDSAVTVGRAFLAEEKLALDEGQILAHIVQLLGGEQAVFSGSEADLRRRIRKVTRGDFETRNTVTVNGWMLASTEVSLCALAALADGHGKPI